MRNQAARLMLIAAVMVVLMAAPAALSAQGMAQKTFATPEEAVKTLAKAASAGDTTELQAIFGPDAKALLSSGDPVDDRKHREIFVAAFQEKWRLEGTTPNQRTLAIGKEDWPFPVPLVKARDGWRFDTAAGVEEVHFRRIGRNELKVIQICSTYVRAQQEYASSGRDGKRAGLYAQKLASDPGKQNGLYWKTEPKERPSPLGDLAAQAAAEGYAREEGKRMPFHGYFFRILTAQGKAAPGGAKDYIANGEMSGGFALVAWPAEYRNSGVMTFIVNRDGVVYEKDLGETTPTSAVAMKGYNPDSSWHKSKPPTSSAAKPGKPAK
jgi:hypothetical protein